MESKGGCGKADPGVVSLSEMKGVALSEAQAVESVCKGSSLEKSGKCCGEGAKDAATEPKAPRLDLDAWSAKRRQESNVIAPSGVKPVDPRLYAQREEQLFVAAQLAGHQAALELLDLLHAEFRKGPLRLPPTLTDRAHELTSTEK